MIIRSQLDIILQENNLNQNQHEALSGVNQAVTRLSKLSQSLLILSKIEHDELDNSQKINLKEALENKLQDLEELWKSGSYLVDIELNHAECKISPELADLLLNNLLNNALQHIPKKGKVQIKLGNHCLEIKNSALNGSLDIERIFTRFYKQSEEPSNNGLELAIVWQICQRASRKITYNFSNEMHYFLLMW